MPVCACHTLHMLCSAAANACVASQDKALQAAGDQKNKAGRMVLEALEALQEAKVRRRVCVHMCS